MPKNWLEIRATGKGKSKDKAVALLVEAGSPGVVEDAGEAPKDLILSHSTWAGTADEFLSESGTASLKAYIPSNLPFDAGSLKKTLDKIGWKFTASNYTDTDWSVKWKAHIRPVRVALSGTAFVVRPPWKSVKRKAGDMAIVIDPGMAFGTGGHETTKACLKALLWLFKGRPVKVRERAKSSFLDVGTGSGILAMAAKKLGVKKAVGIDVDAVAVKVARQNARVNKARVLISGKPLERLKGSFDVVAANIISSELKRLAPALKARLAPKGFLVLSGLLDIESAEVANVFSLIGLKQVKSYSSKEWRTLVLVREDCRPGL